VALRCTPVSNQKRCALAIARHPSAHVGIQAACALDTRCMSPRQELNLTTDTSGPLDSFFCDRWPSL